METMGDGWWERVGKAAAMWKEELDAALLKPGKDSKKILKKAVQPALHTGMCLWWRTSMLPVMEFILQTQHKRRKSEKKGEEYKLTRLTWEEMIKYVSHAFFIYFLPWPRGPTVSIPPASATGYTRGRISIGQFYPILVPILLLASYESSSKSDDSLWLSFLNHHTKFRCFKILLACIIRIHHSHLRCIGSGPSPYNAAKPKHGNGIKLPKHAVQTSCLTII